MGDSAIDIHSNRSLAQRRAALEGFKSGRYRILVATDIASRGIDVQDIALVINFDLPDNLDDYVHRIGRTGRAGNFGKAVSFATPEQRASIRHIERLIRKTIPILSLPELPPGRGEVAVPPVSNYKKNYSRSGRSVRNRSGAGASSSWGGRRSPGSKFPRRSGR